VEGPLFRLCLADSRLTPARELQGVGDVMPSLDFIPKRVTAAIEWRMQKIKTIPFILIPG
jgi:hypothetical protein